MMQQKRKFHIVKNGDQSEDAMEQVVEQIVSELNSEGETLAGIEEEVRLYKKKRRKRILIGCAGIVIAAVAVFALVYFQLYGNVRVTDTYAIKNASDNNYTCFGNGIMKYSRDGVSYLSLKGKELWNQPYQMKTPMTVVNEKTAVVAEKGGNAIMVFQKDGLKGEVETTLPIEKVVVSQQGIVAAILANGNSPQIVCYDAAGNVLVEHKTTMSGSGYPLDLAISADGMLLQVLYMRVEAGQIVSKVAYYNFGESGEDATDHMVASKEIEGDFYATGFFVGDSASVAVAGNQITVFDKKDKPQEKRTIKLKKKLKSVFYDEAQFGVLLENANGTYEMRVYTSSGKQVFSVTVNGNYKNVKMAGGKIIMYEGKSCNIYTTTGQHRFKGDMKNNIFEIIPVFGINKYVIADANGIESIQLIK